MRASRWTPRRPRATSPTTCLLPKSRRNPRDGRWMSDQLLSAAAVRRHCGEVAAEAIEGRSDLFRWNEARLPIVAAYVVDVIRGRYPDLRVPIHSRWRHFEAGGVDRW